ncbi:MAG: restriction endonuclease subunit S [Hoeflea sp.]|uniref:restriction endonuclease subunit S n=1 Tax=Hoeflea sp. TaxID=1940281 RepID=UPI003EF6C79A
MTTISEFITGFYDGPHATPKDASEGPIFLGIKNVTPEGRLDFSDIRHVADDDFPKWTKRVTPQKNDIVFTYEATLHRYAIIPEGFNGCLGRRMALMRPDVDKVFPRFLHYYCLSSAWRREAEASVISGATVDRIPLTKVPDFAVDIPDLPIQKRIASILSAYDDLMENNQRRIGLLEEAAWLLYREWFVHFRFPGYEHVKIVDLAPEGWKHGKVCDLGLTVTGKTPSKKVDANFGDDLPFIKTPDMHGNVFVIRTEESLSEQGANTQKNKTLPIGSILVSCIGTVGTVAMNASPAQTNQQINAVVPKHPHWQFFAYFALKVIKPRLEAMGGGATMANVNKTKFESVPILMPGDDLVLSFHEIVKPQFDLIEKLARQNLELSRARALLLPRLMDGRLEV